MMMTKAALAALAVMLLSVPMASAYRFTGHEYGDDDIKLSVDDIKSAVTASWPDGSVTVRLSLLIDTNIVVCTVYGWEWSSEGCIVQPDKTTSLSGQWKFSVKPEISGRKYGFKLSGLPTNQAIKGAVMSISGMAEPYSDNSMIIDGIIVVDFSDMMAAGFHVKLDGSNAFITFTGQDADLDPNFQFHSTAIDFVDTAAFGDDGYIMGYHESGTDDVYFDSYWANGTALNSSIVAVDSSATSDDGQNNLAVCHFNGTEKNIFCFTDSDDSVDCYCIYNNGSTCSSR